VQHNKRQVSVIIVNWNGREILKDCFDALRRQTYLAYESILVDNCSADLSRAFVRDQYPEVRIVDLPKNVGFAAGNAAGLKESGGDFIALLNNDARPEKNWLENLIQPMLADSKVGICASKILFSSDRSINSAGDGITNAAVGFNRGLGRSADEYNASLPSFGACGAAVLYRRRMLEEIGFLDDDFFLYDEDTDLSFRAQLAGWKCVYVPTARVVHISNATSIRLSDTHVYYHTRNLEFVWIKNMPLGLMLRFAHQKLLQEIGSFCYLCLRHGKWVPYLKAKRDALKMLPRMWNKRRAIQARRRVSNAYLRSLMTSMFTWSFLRQKIRQFIKG